MPNPNPYFVGTTLTDIGNNMSRAQGFETQQAIAQMQMRQQQAAMIRQAMLEREKMAQQQQQFAQEMAYRNASLGQEGDYRKQLLGLRDRELSNNINGFSARDAADNAYRYAALQNHLDIEKQRSSQLDPRLAVEKERQAALNMREIAAAQEAWDMEDAAAKAKTSQYNALVADIEAKAKKLEQKSGWGFDDPDSRKVLADEARQKGYAELNNALSLDKRPGEIIQDPITKRFQPVGRPRPGGARITGAVNPSMANNPAGFSVAQAVGQGTTSTGSSVADKPVKVRTSDGQIWDTTASRFGLFKRRDPGAVILNPTAAPSTGGATGSWDAPSQYSNPANIDALLRALN